ncbi:hypothetical protein V8C35DRAFT_286670 [Trichoderma chlorosporum]
MCFGGKNERSDDPPPRPAQNLSGRPDVKTSRHSAPPNASAGGPSKYGQPLYQQQRYEEFASPPGPPPGKRQEEQYAPPAGPPPGRQQQQYDDYAPPSGPPPSHYQGDYAPPPGPPPSAARGDWTAPPSDPYASQSGAGHDWQTAVPDTSLFPPPPPLFSGHDASYANNATEAEAEAGEAWCRQYPLSMPMTLDQPGKHALQSNNIRLMEPSDFRGTLKWLAPGHWEGSTARKSPDRCIIGYPPLYVVKEHDPSVTNQPKTIYYEVKIRRDSRTINLALGFTALPYPSFRLPGWHRGSLAVHGDDGHKYINDRWGGKDFANEYRAGDTYGIGMTFAPTGTHHPRVDIFFTRNGQRSGGWHLHEETDAAQDLPVTGLEGFHDLSCAIGAFEATSFEVVFDPSKWLYKEAKFDL